MRHITRRLSPSLILVIVALVGALAVWVAPAFVS
jgi:hypothetical protein